MKWVGIIAALLAGLVVAAVAGLWIVGLSSNDYESAIDISRPAAEVWPWITEPAKQKQWVSLLTEVRTLTPETARMGSRAVWIMIDPGMNNQRIEIDSEVTGVVPNERLDLRIRSRGMFSGHATYTLTPLPGGGTHLLNAGTYHYDQWLSRLVEPLVRPEVRRKMEADMLRLKLLAEGTAH